MFNDEDDLSLAPINFFQLSFDCFEAKGAFPYLSKQKSDKYALPDTSSLTGDDAFATVFMGWNKEGIEAHVIVEKAFEETTLPDVTKGDSIELFFDTRDVKTSGFNTRFCHHFFFLPEPVDGQQAGEITRFRTEDVHELCDPKELKVKSNCGSKGYSLQLFIPGSCLYGYDPDQFNRIGFSYRINRYRGEPQHFSVISSEYQIEQQPSLWASGRLVK